MPAFWRSYVRPITLDVAQGFVAVHHRHNKPPHRCRFSIGLFLVDEFGLFGADRLCAVAMVGRPVARLLDDGVTAEVVRLCVDHDAPMGSCSKLYRAAWRAWSAMGGLAMVTYTLQSESGASLRGAGWLRDADLPGRTGRAWCNRDGRADQAVVREPKIRWRICCGHRGGTGEGSRAGTGSCA
jgi:hypothetical protein